MLTRREMLTRCSTGFGMLALQGPASAEIMARVASPGAAALRRYGFEHLEIAGAPALVSRTGYTGSDGFEIYLGAGHLVRVFDSILAEGKPLGVVPAGLGARDTLRLEAAMNLYGTDMDEDVSPLEAGLGWTIAWEPAERSFIGRAPLEEKRADSDKLRFVGLLLEDKGVLRGHQRVVVEGVGDGEITSGGFSPTIERSIALARVPAGDYDRAQVDVRGRLLNVRIVKTPFVRNGQIRIEV